MYCYNCGKPIPDDAKFCNHCGTAQQMTSGYHQGRPQQTASSNYNQNTAQRPASSNYSQNTSKTSGTTGNTGNKSQIWGALGLVFAVFIGMVILISISADRSSSKPASSSPKNVPSTSSSSSSLFSSSSSTQDGWVEKNGEDYYYQNGVPVTGLRTIGGTVYGFQEDGKQMKDDYLWEDGILYCFDTYGILDSKCYNSVDVAWASESYKLGDGGYSAVLETLTPVKKCTSLNFIVSSEGNYGSSVTGQWEVLFRINGQWKKITTFHYGGGEQTVFIRFDGPTNFDAVTAYPVQRGNYSYQSYFNFQGLNCEP